MAPWSTETIVATEVNDGHRWVDLSGYVVRRGGPIIVASGRQSVLSMMDDGTTRLVLQNATEDARFTTITDTFTRSVTDGWGTTDTGETYTTAGTAADFDVDGSVGTMAHTATNAIHRARCGTDTLDFDRTISFATDTLASGAGLSAGPFGRFDDANNYYNYRAVCEIDQTVTAEFRPRVGGVETTLASATVTGLTHAVGEYIRVRAQCVGNWHRVKVWAASATEPQRWNVTYYDDQITTPGNGGPRSLRHSGNTSGTTVFSFDDYVDLDPYAGAGRFTSGYTDGPFYPWWRESIKVRVRETVGTTVFDLGTTHLQIPDVTETLEGVDNLVTVQGVDALARLGRARRMISVVAEHILGQRKSTLAAYWPLAESAVDELSARTMREQKLPSTLTPTTGLAEIRYGDGTGPRADDIGAALFTSATDGTDTALSMSLVLVEVDNAPLWELEAGQTITVVVWVHMDWSRDEALSTISLSTDDGSITVTRQPTDSGTAPGEWRITKPIGDLTGNTASGAQAPSLMAHPIALRFGYDPNVLEVWVEDEDFTATLSGTLSPTPLAVRQIQFAALEGSLSHAQVYVGDPGDFTITDLAGQVEVGRHGHARQKTGDRIRMICNYFGIPDGQLNLDPGVAYMQRAQFAGRQPRDALDNAVTTEQGRLFVDGSGLITFHDRRRIYNI